MKYSIGKMISKSIKENKWLSIDYVNKNNEHMMKINANDKWLILKKLKKYNGLFHIRGE